MNYKSKLFGLWIALSLALGWLMDPLVVDLREQRNLGGGESIASLSSSLGSGVSIAAFGGYRTIAANLVWISMYGDWQYRRTSEVLEKMNLAVALNPDAETFWISGARIIANDLPVWEVGDDLAASLFEQEQGIAVRHEYGRRALKFLEKAPDWLENEVNMLVEKGVICWQKLDDLDCAVAYFEQAVRQEDSPFYVSRVYAELLRKNGQVRAAYEFLVSHYEQLPEGRLDAMKPLVARRIAELEKELEKREP